MIVVGVDASDLPDDAIALAQTLAGATHCRTLMPAGAPYAPAAPRDVAHSLVDLPTTVAVGET